MLLIDANSFSFMFLSWYCLIKMAKENLPTRQFNMTDRLIPRSFRFPFFVWVTCSIFIQILIESDEWFSPFSLSEPLVERRAFERRAKRGIQKMNAWASAIQRKKLSGERTANLEKMSECPALGIIQSILSSFNDLSTLFCIICVQGTQSWTIHR